MTEPFLTLPGHYGLVISLAGNRITANIPPEALDLPFAAFAERYFEPAYAVVQLHRRLNKDAETGQEMAIKSDRASHIEYV